jgi:tRNA(Ile)-lysidine synthase
MFGGAKRASKGDNGEVNAAPVLERLRLLAPEARTLLLAVSGGGDSVALLRLLLGSPYRLLVAHVDHALRPESAADAAFVAALGAAHDLPVASVRLEVAQIARARGWNLEDAARRLRYDFLTRTAKRSGADLIVTAHTQDDQAETVLLQLLRGTAQPRGIPPRRGRVVRPLLGLSRRQLREHLAALGQSYREDPSNADTQRTRAWLRYEIVPRLEARYPHLKATLARLAALQRDQAEALAAQAEALFYEGGLELGRLKRAPAAVQRAALAALLRRADVPPDLTHLEVLREHLSENAPLRLSLPKAKTARLAYGRLEVVAQVREPSFPEALRAGALPAEVDPRKLAAFPPLHVRTRLPGDRIQLPGGSKKLSDLLIDRKVPREQRDHLKVLATTPDRAGEVLWVEGVATDVRVARSDPMDPDRAWMQRALRLAETAAAAGEVPVGAVVVRGDALLAAAANTVRAVGDPTAHAEITALREAARHLGDWRLAGCTLYVTLEPCPMCLGAALSAHLPRLVYGATNHREGALGGVADLLTHPWKRTLSVRSGVLAAQAGRLMHEFFMAQRAAQR